MKNTVVKIIGIVIQAIVMLSVLIGGSVAASIGISGLIEAAGVLLGTTLGSTALAIVLWRVVNVISCSVLTYYGISSAASMITIFVEDTVNYVKKFGGFISSKLFKKANDTVESC